MAFRDELIEAATEAVRARAKEVRTIPWRDAAEIALDAILARLEDPSDDMIIAANDVSGCYPDTIFRAMLAPLKA